jgi:hypothetical protein
VQLVATDSSTVEKVAQLELVAEVLLAPLMPISNDEIHAGQLAPLAPALAMRLLLLSKIRTACRPEPGTAGEPTLEDMPLKLPLTVLLNIIRAFMAPAGTTLEFLELVVTVVLEPFVLLLERVPLEPLEDVELLLVGFRLKVVAEVERVVPSQLEIEIAIKIPIHKLEWKFPNSPSNLSTFGLIFLLLPKFGPRLSPRLNIGLLF